MLTNENDISTKLFDELAKLKVNLAKEALEIVGEDLGITDNVASYKNFTYKNPVHLEGVSLGNKFAVTPAVLVTAGGSFDSYEGGELVPKEKLEQIFPKANKTYLSKCVDALIEYGPKIGLNYYGQLMVLAQFAHESNEFRNLKEIGGENRPYGQPQPPYGKRYYGRGPIQVTFKNNYKIIWEKAFPKMGISANIYENPDLCEDNMDIGIAASIGWLMSVQPKCVQAANERNLNRLTKLINGGYNGLDSRRRYTNLLFSELA